MRTHRVFSLILLLTVGTATGALAAPPPPTSLVAFVTGSAVQLIWTASPSPILGYRLDMGLSPGSTIAYRLLPPDHVGSLTGFLAGPLPNGTYYARVHAFDVTGFSAPSNEVVVVVGSGGCSLVPGFPTGLAATVNGSQVTLIWGPGNGCPATNFQVHAGSAPGSSNLAVINVGSAQTLSATAPAGVYYVRAFAQNAAGTSLPSNEVVVAVGPGVCGLPPAAPTGLFANVSGSQVMLGWGAGNGCPATSFELHAGSAPGSSNLVITNVGNTQTLSVMAPPGVYYVRVLARNAAGPSLSSNEVVVNVGAPSR